MNPNEHTCAQNIIDILDQQYRIDVKNTIKNYFKISYSVVFEKKQLRLLNSIADPGRREQLRRQLPSWDGFKTAAYTARKEGLHKGPEAIDDIDTELLRSAKLDPSKYILAQDLTAGVVLFGTRTLCQEFVEASFKSLDGTYQIDPINFIKGCISGLTREYGRRKHFIFKKWIFI